MDIQLTQDIQIQNNDFALTPNPNTAIPLALLVYKRHQNQYGYWANQNLGSTLYTLLRSNINNQTLTLAEDTAKEALLNYDEISEVQTIAFAPTHDRITLRIQAKLKNGSIDKQELNL